jgi:hypothetical protein
VKKQTVIEVKSIDSSIVAVALHGGLVDDKFTAGRERFIYLSYKFMNMPV